MTGKVELEIQRLNRLENYRKEFIGDISHELKTPIFAVQGFFWKPCSTGPLKIRA